MPGWSADELDERVAVVVILAGHAARGGHAEGRQSWRHELEPRAAVAPLGVERTGETARVGQQQAVVVELALGRVTDETWSTLGQSLHKELDPTCGVLLRTVAIRQTNGRRLGRAVTVAVTAIARVSTPATALGEGRTREGRGHQGHPFDVQSQRSRQGGRLGTPIKHQHYWYLLFTRLHAVLREGNWKIRLIFNLVAQIPVRVVVHSVPETNGHQIVTQHTNNDQRITSLPQFYYNRQKFGDC
jgi:hypothetical protein